MTNTHKLVPIEPTEEMIEAWKKYDVESPNIAPYETSISGYYKAMLASAPEVGEAVDMDENTAKRFRGILSMLGISAPESDESLMLCQFSLLGMVRHKIQQVYDQPYRTAQLEDRIAELEQESSWIRQRLDVPEDANLFTSEFAGAIHKIVYRAQGYTKYVESYKCDDKQGEIARQSVQIAQLEQQLAERDEEIERLQSYEQGLNDVIAWMKERGLYHDADYFGEGADFAALLTEHEQQVSACTERQLEDDNKRLVEALREASGRGTKEKRRLFDSLLAEMEAKGC